MNCKQELRKSFREIRRFLSQERHLEAQQQLLKNLAPFCSSFQRIASFSSMKDEIDLTIFNTRLAQEQRLLLPRRHGNLLQFYLVMDLHLQLESTGSGQLLEPIPDRCQAVELSNDDLLFVPALAFDREHYRLGYGKGFYDRLLARTPTITAWGIGFREQFSKQPLLRDPWDRPVHKTWLL